MAFYPFTLNFEGIPAMSKKFIPTRKTDPCALCGDITGKCRTTESVRLCMTLTETVPVPGFKFLGRTKDSLWGKWIADTGQDWTEQQRQAWQRELNRRQSAESQHPSLSLAASDRDKYYRHLLDQLSLHSDDQADLHRRGLSDEQIEHWGVKSVEQWQPLDRELSHTLPGVSLSGRSLITSGAGYLCPIRDVEGQIVGFQLRLRDSASGGRYRWLTSATQKRPDGPSPHLPHGELPLAVHRPLSLSRSAIALVEGVGAKPFILAQRQGVVTIGAAGGQFASSPATLKHTLEVLAAELDSRTIEFYPDAGAILNRQVLRQYRATWKLLRQWGYEIQILWWGQETKSSPDIDELEDFSQLQPITIAQFETIARPRLNWLAQIQRLLQHRPTPSQSAAALEQVLTVQQETEPDAVEYQAGDRHHIWKQAINQGYRYILDLSPPGSGKSFDAGQVDSSSLEAIRQVIYVSDQHRNPTVETLSISNGWIDLEARHGGLVTESTPGGSNRHKRAGKGETPSIPANCNRTRLIEAFRGKHIQGADTASVICQTCPLRETCSHAQGPGYGFLNQRRSALSSPKLRSHPDSLPNPQEYDFAQVLLLWDEPGQSFNLKRDIQVKLKDIEQLLPALVPHPELFHQLQELVVTLLDRLGGPIKPSKFGLNHCEVVQLLPDVSHVNIAAVAQVLYPDLSFINRTIEHGVDLADLPPSLRKQFSEKDAEMATQAEQRILKQWLPDLLRILQGQNRGTLHLHRGSLTLSLADPRHRAIAQAAKAVIFLDATLSRQDLALNLGCQPEEIYLCQQFVPTPTNLTLIQVTDLGRMGMQRGNNQQQRAMAIVTHYQTLDPATQVIDFKKFATQDMGAWWRDSRGSNDFEQDRTLILVGTPCRNLADLLAEYAILTGCHDLEDPGFQAFVDRAIRADFHQAIGRLRAHRRPEEKLQVVLLSNFPLDITTQTVLAREITMAAATPAEQTWQVITQAVEVLWQQLHRQPTQQEVATATGVKQAQISKLSDQFLGGWRFALEIFRSLLKIPYSHWNIFEPVTEVINEEVWIAKEFLPLVVIEDVAAVLEQLGMVVKTFEWDGWQRIVSLLDLEVRSKLASALALNLPVELQRALIAASGARVSSR